MDEDRVLTSTTDRTAWYRIGVPVNQISEVTKLLRKQKAVEGVYFTTIGLAVFSYMKSKNQKHIAMYGR